jgi:hypothetical protein
MVTIMILYYEVMITNMADNFTFIQTGPGQPLPQSAHCPDCHGELRESKFDPNYLLCRNCGGKFHLSEFENVRKYVVDDDLQFSGKPFYSQVEANKLHYLDRSEDDPNIIFSISGNKTDYDRLKDTSIKGLAEATKKDHIRIKSRGNKTISPETISIVKRFMSNYGQVVDVSLA